MKRRPEDEEKENVVKRGGWRGQNQFWAPLLFILGSSWVNRSLKLLLVWEKRRKEKGTLATFAVVLGTGREGGRETEQKKGFFVRSSFLSSGKTRRQRRHLYLPSFLFLPLCAVFLFSRGKGKKGEEEEKVFVNRDLSFFPV